MNRTTTRSRRRRGRGERPRSSWSGSRDSLRDRQIGRAGGRPAHYKVVALHPERNFEREVQADAEDAAGFAAAQRFGVVGDVGAHDSESLDGGKTGGILGVGL